MVTGLAISPESLDVAPHLCVSGHRPYKGHGWNPLGNFWESSCTAEGNATPQSPTHQPPGQSTGPSPQGNQGRTVVIKPPPPNNLSLHSVVRSVSLLGPEATLHVPACHTQTGHAEYICPLSPLDVTPALNSCHSLGLTAACPDSSD